MKKVCHERKLLGQCCIHVSPDDFHDGSCVMPSLPVGFSDLGVNPLRAKFFKRKHKHIFIFCGISPH